MSPEREGRPEVSLGRLCAVARLGPGPGVAAGRAVLGALAELHERGLVHGVLDPRAVRVDAAGGVRLEGDGMEAAPGERVAELERAWRMIRDLLDASVVTPPAPLRALLAGPLPLGGARAALAALEAAAGELARPSGERRAAARLAELVEPLHRYGHGPAQLTLGAPEAATVISAGSRPAAPPPPAPPRSRRRRVLVILGAAGAAAVGAGIWAARGSAGPVAPSTGGSTTAAATPLPAPPRPAPIPDPPAPAPPSAGVVSAVRLEPAAGPCLPAAVCVLQLRVDLLPRSTATTVRVTVEVVDRCTGARTDVVVAPMRAAAAAASTTTRVRVRVGAGPAPALLALTTAPARAASAPVLVAPFLPSC